MAISPNTQAILLLAAPLVTGRAAVKADVLTPSEYRRLARFLHGRGQEPAALIGPEAESLIVDCGSLVESDRLHRLLGRGFLLSQALERWQSRSIWVVSRADKEYPARLRRRLRDASPPVLYGSGDPGLLNGGGLAVVGSRNVDDALVEFTERVGSLTAAAGRMIISGGARGIDQAAMRGAAAAGGTVVGVLADRLERAVLDRDNRNLLRERRLALISPYDPSAGFNVGHAMQRNKLIYALADAGLVVSADLRKGGTWAGAVEQVEKLRFVPVFVRANGISQPGLEALQTKGAAPWPHPRTPRELDDLIVAAGRVDRPRRPKQKTLFVGEDAEARYEQTPAVHSTGDQPHRTAESPINEMGIEIPYQARAFLARMTTARSLKEIAAELEVSQRRASDWLRVLIDEGVVEKQERPAVYRSGAGNRSLFD